MNKEFSIMQLSRQAWHDFCKEWKSWLMLSFVALLFVVIVVLCSIYSPEYEQMVKLILFIPEALYAALLHQNGLDAAYGRKLTLFAISQRTLFATLFFIAILLYNPLPEYVEILLFVFPEDFAYIVAINWLMHIIISYILVRCMFVGMIILEEKLDVLAAFKKSFRLTAHHLLFFMGFFAYIILISTLSVVTIFGYLIALPYTIIMKSLLFKKLNQA